MDQLGAAYDYGYTCAQRVEQRDLLVKHRVPLLHLLPLLARRNVWREEHLGGVPHLEWDNPGRSAPTTRANYAPIFARANCAAQRLLLHVLQRILLLAVPMSAC